MKISGHASVIVKAITAAARGMGFGKFKIESAAGDGRNPSIGETFQIAVSTKLGFTCAEMEDTLNG